MEQGRERARPVRRGRRRVRVGRLAAIIVAFVAIAAAVVFVFAKLVGGFGAKPDGTDFVNKLSAAFAPPFPIYTVHFNVGESEGASVEPAKYVIERDARPGKLPVARMDGMRFTGWYTAPGGDEAATRVDNASLALIPGNADTTLYARFEPKPTEVDKSVKGLPVLMYHYWYVPEQGEKSPNGNYLNIHTFEKQIEWLQANGYYLPEWSEVIDFIYGNALLPDKSIVLTSDDAYESFFRLGIPTAEKYGVRLTCFVIGIDHKAEDFAPYKDHPLLSFQSHSYALHRREPNPDGIILRTARQDVIDDLAKSKEISGSIDVFAYPFGHFNDEAESSLEAAGVKLAFTTQGGICYPMMNPYALPRIRVDERNSFEEWVNRVSV